MVVSIKNRYDNITLESCIINEHNKNFINYLKDYIKNIDEKINNCENLILSGNCGVGKTFIIKAFLNEVKNKVIEKEKAFFNEISYKIDKKIVNENINIFYTNIYNMLADLRKVYDKKEADINYNTFDILIIDEIGVQFSTDGERQILYDVFNYRWENYKPTFLISNYSVEELKKILGARIFDRINNKNTKNFTLTGNSMR